MKKYIVNFSKWIKLNYRIPAFSWAAIVAMSLTTIGCSNLESDQAVEPSVASQETNPSSQADIKKITGEKCDIASQELTDRYSAYIATFVDGDVDKMYSFWTPDFHDLNANAMTDRDALREQMVSFYASGGKLDYTVKLLERNVYNDVAYDIGSFDDVTTLNGMQFILNGYYFTRFIKGNDGIWLIDKSVAGPRDGASGVNPNEVAPVVCYDTETEGNAMFSQQITERFTSYVKALTSGNADKAYKFWTEDFHFYGQGLNVDRDGLYQHYSNFFKTGSIVSSNASLKYRFVHGNVAYDIGQSDDTVVVNNTQSIKKYNYVIRWEKDQGGTWRISRIINVTRN